ncbi:hypothetical protein QBZ16_003380 [Prototheca wickerhamii]|uniref:MPN domain-containing protein n=1 Tax=Prototheca wickerhamii TaxID=3111 RepID=A0AAD9MKR3_PROWI|nr:hypothetical protein QBZ16_003380 [Prototheca wickerhamii]
MPGVGFCRPLDPNCASARAYGLRAAAFHGGHCRDWEARASSSAKRARKNGRRRSASDSEAEEGLYDEGDGYDPDLALALALSSSATEQNLPAQCAAPPAKPAPEPTEYVRNRPRRAANVKLSLGDTSESLDLTCPRDFVGAPGSAASLAQPFAVLCSSQARAVMELHAHLTGFEVIGLLGGSFDPGTRTLQVQEAYPCRRVDADGADSGTSVELDAASQVEATSAMASRGQIAVGWYHSHPVFEARPSQKDNENQRNYQALCHDASTGLAPWVGVIISPYLPSLPSPVSQLRMWVVRLMAGALVPFTVRFKGWHTAVGPDEAQRMLLAMQRAMEAQGGDPCRVDLASPWHEAADCSEPDGTGWTKLRKLQVALERHLGPAGYQQLWEALEGSLQKNWCLKGAQ